MLIPRRELDSEFSASMKERAKTAMEDLAHDIELAQSNPDLLGWLGTSAKRAAVYRAMAAPGSPDIGTSLKLAAHVQHLVMMLITQPLNTMVVQLDGGAPFCYRNAPNGSFRSAIGWLDAFFLNMIFGKLDTLRQLCAIPTRLLKQSSNQGKDYHYQFKDAICAFIHGSGPVFNLCQEAVKAAIRDERAREREYLPGRALWSYEIELFYYITNRNSAKFEQTLHDALRSFDEFWSHPPERMRNPEGVFAFHLTGLMALARHHGLQFDVESPYLLPALIEPVR